jgi:DNA-binding response OmpR family regulator
MRLLLAEDDEHLSLLLREAFNKAGFDVDLVRTAHEARSAVSTNFYATLVLDLGLPDQDGLSLLRDIRKRNRSLPVLILTARDSIGDRVSGLRAGAEDYLVKPFAMEELIVRVQGLLRRGEAEQSFKLGNIELILDQHGSQVFVDGQYQILPARDLCILEILLQRRGRVVSKARMAAHLSGRSTSVSQNAIEVYVHRLRKFLEDHSANVLIHTVKGVGYMIDEHQQDQEIR